jgi:hypothetical protein
VPVQLKNNGAGEATSLLPIRVTLQEVNPKDKGKEINPGRLEAKRGKTKPRPIFETEIEHGTQG